MSLDGKVVLITRACSVIGSDAACHLAKLGAHLSIVGNNAKRLNGVAQKIAKSNSPIPLQIVADVTKDAERIVNETIERFGKLDVLVNIASFPTVDEDSETNTSEFDRIFNANLHCFIRLTNACVPQLELTKGNIVNVTSAIGSESVSNCMSYRISKAAIDQFTKCSALDLFSRGIRVNAINPAAIRTQIFETFGLNAEQSERMLQEFQKRFPIDQIGGVYDTSAAISFLADNQLASFLTGVLLLIDPSIAA